MKQVIWLLGLALLAAAGYWVRHARRRWQERSRAAEQRYAAFMAEALSQARNSPHQSPPKSGAQAKGPETGVQG